MSLLLLSGIFQILSFSQGLNGTVDPSTQTHGTHNEITLSTLSLSDDCFGFLHAFINNTKVYVNLDLLNYQEKEELAVKTCQHLGCGLVFKHNTAAVQKGACVADCALSTSGLHNCTTVAGTHCLNATQVICEHQVVRLVEGQDQCAGRVELLDSGEWGTVCDENFDLKTGNIVCSQLKCGSARTLGSFGVGRGAIHISRMNCTGSESNLWQCHPRSTIDGYCGHKNDASIVCSESITSRPVENAREPPTATQATALTTLAATMRSSAVSAAVIGCIILAITLLIFVTLNLVVCVHFKRATGGCMINQNHSNSHRSTYQTNERTGIYQRQSAPAATHQLYECLGPRTMSNHGLKINTGIEGAYENSPSDSSYESPNICILPQTLHSKLLQTDEEDSGSTSSGECYQPTERAMENPLYGDRNDADESCLGDSPDRDVDINMGRKQISDPEVVDSSSTSSGEFYENKTCGFDHFKADEKDSESTSSGECYYNTEIDMENPQNEPDCAVEEESPSLPVQTLETPDSAPMTGNASGYMDSSAQYQGQESSSLPVIFKNPHFVQMEESSDKVNTHDFFYPFRNLSQETDNSSTSSDALYVNVTPQNHQEEDSATASDTDYDDAGT